MFTRIGFGRDVIQRARAWSVVMAIISGVLADIAPVAALPLKSGDTGLRGAGLRLSASLGAGPSTASEPGVGGRHTCAVIADGSVRCWGANSHGQLGNGATADSNVPVTVTLQSGAALNGVISVAAGGTHACAVRADSTAVCWGNNGAGQLGIANNLKSRSSTALDVAADANRTRLTGVVMVAAGDAHTCALLVDGTIRCWGANSSGQVTGQAGDAVFVPSPVLVGAAPLTGAVYMAAGSGHTCAVGVDGTASTVRCWGSNLDGQLGTGTAGDIRSGVITVVTSDGAAFTGAVKLAAGLGHTCALRVDGTVHCWGRNSDGQVGNNSTLIVTNPVQVLVGATGVAASSFHTCATIVGGTTQCWGRNDQGQIGNNQTGGSQLVPVQVSAARLGDAVAVAAGLGHSCARRVDDTVRCWGDNASGQLGNSVNSDDDEPVPVVGIDPVPSARAIGAGANHTCAVRASGGVACWGENSLGQLGKGDPTGTDQARPVSVNLTGVLTVAAGQRHSCALRVDGAVGCWGDNRNGQLGNVAAGSLSRVPVRVSNLTDAVALAVGAGHACAVRVTGRVSCWGGNFSGQLGDGSTRNRATPVTVMTTDGVELVDVTAIAAGADHTCALHATGAVSCWGSNAVGELGDATTLFRSRAAAVVSLPDATALAAGGAARHTCALRTDGTVRCWGQNTAGQLGDGTTLDRNFPVPVNGMAAAGALAAGAEHSCAALVGGIAKCWGLNGQGQLGNGTTTTPTPPDPVSVIIGFISLPGQVPFPIPLSSVVALTAGNQHTCALLASGLVGCWGDNASGQLGIGDASGAGRSVATTVPSFTFNIATAGALRGHGRIAKVTALALCEPGAKVHIAVEVIQAGTSGRGVTEGRCTGILERYDVTVPAHGPAGFVSGPATAVADATVRQHGEILQQPAWETVIELTP